MKPVNPSISGLLLLLVSVLAGGPADAGEVVSQGVFLTPDLALARTLDRVAVDGDTLLVSYPDADDAGNDRGAVYVVDRNQDGTWTQTGKLLPSPVSGFEFGAQVAISGDVAAVGDATAFGLNGAVWMFRRVAGTFSQTQLLHPPGMLGGAQVAAVGLWGNDLIVGAASAQQGGFATGAVHFYRANGSSWDHQQGPIYPSDTGTTGSWARVVTIHGDYAATSSPLHGRVYVLERPGPGGSWSEVQKIAPAGGASSEFGKGIALEGDLLAVGAPADDEKAENAGAVFIFQRQSGSQWLPQAKLMAQDGAQGDYFGASLALRAGRLVVGAQLDNDVASDAGSAYVFERQGDGTWPQIAKLVHPTPAADDFMGKQCALSADGIIAVVCPNDDDVVDGLGTVLLYDAETLSSATTTLALAQGGTQALDVQGGVGNAGRSYMVLGSLHGTSPGLSIPGGTLPLNHDGYMVFTYTAPNTTLLANSLGVLGAGGGAAAAFHLPAGLSPSFAGLTVSHAFVAFDQSPSLNVTLISNPLSVLLVP